MEKYFLVYTHCNGEIEHFCGIFKSREKAELFISIEEEEINPLICFEIVELPLFYEVPKKMKWKFSKHR